MLQQQLTYLPTKLEKSIRMLLFYLTQLTQKNLSLINPHQNRIRYELVGWVVHPTYTILSY